MPEQTLDELLLQNPNAPTNDHFALQFARELFPPEQERSDSSISFDFAEGPASFEAADNEGTDWCGEPTRGLLEAVVASDLLSDAARTQIDTMMVDAVPSLERAKTIGHFRFRWTESSSNLRDNTTETNIDSTGAILNDCWDRYVTDFREPKANLVNGQRMIDIDVYYDGGLHGSTSSHSNRIFLNSDTVVNDDCRRKTTSAHELFHRVEYSYGYVTGTSGQRWWVEALGSWSQEYYAPDVDDYISRVNTGLGRPGDELLGRSYDACHYWKYLGEQLAARSAAVGSETEAIREVLDEYASNGLDAKAASDTVTQDRISRPFDRFFQDWTKANYLKDLTNPSAKYDYAEDETVTTSCSRTYGPYRHVAPVSDHKITTNATTWSSATQTVGAYSTRYHHFDIDDGVTEFELRFEGNVGGGSGDYSVHVALIKDDRWRRILNSTSTTEVARHITLNPGQYDRCAVVVNGLASGGSYELGLNACLTGVWKDTFNFVWTLTQAGDDVTGTVTTGCGVYSVTGTINGTDLVLEATGNCCDFTYRGVVDECAAAQGDWTNDCNGSGTFSMNKVDGDDIDSLVLDEEEEHADDPTSMGAS